VRLLVVCTTDSTLKGPAPEIKFPTILSRLGQSWANIQLFFRTSSISRSTPGFLYESRIIPPLCYVACLQGLKTAALTEGALQIHFADEEGDPYAVELAGRLGGYVIGDDSDFVVLNSEGYLGYIPLNDMMWSVPVADKDIPVEDDGDFQPVRKVKKKPVKDSGLVKSLIPPDSSFCPTLSCIAYDPSVLASHFNLPVTLLPLLGALVGNDFSHPQTTTQQNIQQLFFDRQLSPSKRITRVASTLQSILSASPLKRKQKQVKSVIDLIDKTIHLLLVRSPSMMSSGEIAAIVEKIVEATLQYAIPKYEADQVGMDSLWPTDVCALHEPEVCPVLPLFSRLISEMQEESEKVVEMKDRVRALHLATYRKGQLSPKIVDILSTGTYWPRLFLEHPDFESVGRSIGRTIRQWGYAILDDGVGLPRKLEEDDGIVDEEDEDELVDVTEEDSDDLEDPLATLRGALQQLRTSNSELPASTLSASPFVPPRPQKFVTEYVRRGTRVSGEEVIVPDLHDLLSSISIPDSDTPIQLRSKDERLTIFLRFLASDIPQVKTLPPEQLTATLALRWVVRTLHERDVQSGSSIEKQSERWTKQEAGSFLMSFSWNSQSETPVVDPPPIINRNVQLTAQVMTALESLLHFSQILLLQDHVSSPVHLFSGRTFHSFLTGKRAICADGLPDGMWEALNEGLADSFAEEQKRKAKKEKTTPISPTVPLNGGKGSMNVSLFELLGDAEA
jgi:hypothetical protein